MNKTEMIDKLLNLSFICLDDDTPEKEREFFSVFENGKCTIEHFLGIKGFISLRTKEQVDKYYQTKEFKDLHLCTHLMMIDNLVSFVALNVPVNLEGLIKETLRCATDKNKDLINALLSLKGRENALAA